MEWLKQHVLLLNITTGFSATKLVIISMLQNTETQHNAIYRKERKKEDVGKCGSLKGYL